jgi:hypothetical protein
MGMTPALDDRMCEKVDRVRAKSQPLVLGELAKEATEDFV